MDVIFTWVFGIAAFLILVYAILQHRAINRYLPPQVREFLKAQELRDIVVQVAHQAGLDNEQRRQASVDKVRAFIQLRFGYTVPDRIVNLVVEILVNRLKEEGIIPKGSVELPIDREAAIPLDKPEDVRVPDPGELQSKSEDALDAPSIVPPVLTTRTTPPKPPQSFDREDH